MGLINSAYQEFHDKQDESSNKKNSKKEQSDKLIQLGQRALLGEMRLRKQKENEAY